MEDTPEFIYYKKHEISSTKYSFIRIKTWSKAANVHDLFCWVQKLVYVSSCVLKPAEWWSLLKKHRRKSSQEMTPFLSTTLIEELDYAQNKPGMTTRTSWQPTQSKDLCSSSAICFPKQTPLFLCNLQVYICISNVSYVVFSWAKRGGTSWFIYKRFPARTVKRFQCGPFVLIWLENCYTFLSCGGAPCENSFSFAYSLLWNCFIYIVGIWLYNTTQKRVTWKRYWQWKNGKGIKVDQLSTQQAHGCTSVLLHLHRVLLFWFTRISPLTPPCLCVCNCNQLGW